ncbi:MAG TPA: hypothetical protein VEB19_15480 [Gemmatimonadaceae bacterium]|nr:hypothetical protein [Gemmatimonadaceae bacterium]
MSARISVETSGDMQLDLKGDDFRVLPNRSFTVSTPATLIIVRGMGTATITSVDSTSRLAVIPAATPQDSIDAATITGTVISFTRSSGDGVLQPKVVRP